jgi:integrase
LPYADLPDFLETLRNQEGVGARALEFMILTAARTGEAIGARWSEINMVDKVWTVPANRMKAGREHRVPLSPRVIAILADLLPSDAVALERGQADLPVFEGTSRGKPLSNMALLMLLRRMERDDITAHGFRSTFRDWAAERTNFPSDVAEMALAHTVGDKVEAAYRRSTLFERRRGIMADWAKFCGSPKASVSDNVTTLRRLQ